MRREALVGFAAAAAFTLAGTILLFVACGHKRANVTQLTIAQPETAQAVQEQQSTGGGTENEGTLPPVLALDALAGGCKSVRNGSQVMSFGADYMPEYSGTTSDREYSIEPFETALKLRAFAPGDYAFAVYGQEIGAAAEPLRTLIDTDTCQLGGGQDDDIPLIYYLGFADYTQGSWRWFGPYNDVDVLVRVNSEALKSRFKSPNNNYYLCVLTTNGSKAASALPQDGLVAHLPFEPTARAVSEDELDPGGVTVEMVTTDTGDAVTEPAMVTGLTATADASGVTLGWDANPDPFVFVYRVRRDDLDDEDPPLLLESVLPPRTSYKDETGVPGKEYEYSVRALKVGDLQGGSAVVKATRSLAAPTVTASDGAHGDHVHIEWAAVEGAEGYSVLRADAIDGAKTELASVDAAALFYDDYDAVLAQVYYYWIRALGEDADGPLGGPDSGFCIELEPVQVTATDGDYPDRVELVWGESDEPMLEAYNVYRDTDEDEAGADLIDTVYPPEHAYADTTAPWNEQRFYFVKPVVGGTPLERGVGDWGYRGLAIPGNVTATKGTNAEKVTIGWEAVNNATRYKVYRSESEFDPDPIEITEIAAPATSCDDAPDGWSGTEGQHYFYFVAALHDGPDTEKSGFGTDEGWRGIAAPATVTASNGTLGDRVAVSWSAVSQATVYQVFRDGSPIGDPIEAPTTTYADYNTAFGAHHDYAVKAGIDLGYGPMSLSDEGWRGLLAPANVQASDGEYTDKIAVTWGLVNTATGYRIYRSEIDDDPSPPFLASVTGGTTTSYDDFSAVPNTQYWYSVSAWITVQLNEGPRSADDVGTIGNKSPVADLSANPTEGDAPLTVNFDASASYDDDGSIVKYEWDWENDGTYDHDSGDDPTVSHEYTEAGEYTCKLRVTDDDGATDADNLTVKVYRWKTVVVDSEGDVGQYTSLAVVNGNPAVSYYDDTQGDLKYVRASDASGSTWGTPLNIDSPDDTVGSHSSLAMVNGRPAISYHDWSNYALKYVRANDTNGSVWGTPVTIDDGGYAGEHTSLAVVNGNPAISYYGNGAVKYVRATDSNGSSWATPIIVDSVGDVGYSTSLTVVNGCPAISYFDLSNYYLKYVRSQDANGETWNDPIVVDASGVVGYDTSLAVVDGKPAIGYRHHDDDDLRYVRAQDPNGETWNDPVIVDDSGRASRYMSLKVVNGVPAMSYLDWSAGDLKYVTASDEAGSSWNGPVAVDSEGYLGQFTSLAVVCGEPAISYYDKTNGDLKYAYYTTEP